MTRRQRADRRRALVREGRAELRELQFHLRGVRLKTRRRLAPVAGRGWELMRLVGELLRPLGAPIQRLGARIAPYVSRVLFIVFALLLGLVSGLLDLWLRTLAAVRSRLGTAVAGLSNFISVEVTPLRTLVAVCVLAAVALGASQFIDYRGVAVGADQYEGEVGTVAPVPRTDLKVTGEPHFYAMLPLAALTLLLVWWTVRGRWRLGRAIGLIGMIGILVSLGIDAPQGLDAGDAGAAYEGTEAQLIEGFWAQLVASIVLLIAGPALGHYAQRAAEGGDPRRQGRRRAGVHRASPTGAPETPSWGAGL